MMQRKILFLFVLALLGMTMGARASDIAGYTPKSKIARQMVVRLGPDEKAPEMQIVLDSKEAGDKEVNLAVADLNLNGKLSDDEATSGNAPDGVPGRQFQIPVVAPFGNVDSKADYQFHIIGWADPPVVFATVQLNENQTKYSYMIIGKGQPDAKDRKISRFQFGAPMTLQVEGKSNGTSLTISSTIKDAQGQVLRTVSKDSKEIVPHLIVKSPSGKIIVDKDMQYG